MLGCADCYESFYEQIVPDLRKFHGSSRHTGRKPGGGKGTAPEPTRPPARPQAEPPESDSNDRKNGV